MHLTEEEARRIILTRQGLITPFATELEAVRAMVAVQTQYAQSLAVAVAARVRRARPDWDREALCADGQIVKGWSVRNTLHAHHAEVYDQIVAAIGEPAAERIRSWWVKEGWFTPDEVPEIEARMLEALSGGPLSRKELHAAVPELRRITWAGWGADVMSLAFQRRLCVIGAGADQRFCRRDPGSNARSMGQLLRLYLNAYGPATRGDFAHWAGLRMPGVNEAFRELEAELTPVQIEGRKALAYVVGELPEVPTEPLGVRLLAKFDVLVLSHRDKTLFLAEADRTRVFRKAGQVEATLLVAGRVAGTWRMTRKSGQIRVVIDPFRALKRREISATEREVERLRRALNEKGAECEIRPVD